MKRLVLFFTAMIVLVGLGFVGYKNFILQSDLNTVIGGDSRNAGVQAQAHYNNYYDFSTVVLDLQSISGNNTRLDVFRFLLQFAKAEKKTTYQQVILSFRGSPKFMVDGSYFQLLGTEYDTQNPVYTTRTFPSHLRRPDRTKPYIEWPDSLFTVSEQMKDFNDFHDKWYWAELVSR